MEPARKSISFVAKGCLFFLLLPLYYSLFAMELNKMPKQVLTRNNANQVIKNLENFVITVAKKDLHNTGGFAPFGVAVDKFGNFKIMTGSGLDTKSDLNNITDKYREKAKSSSIVAAAIVYDTRINQPDRVSMDAIYITSDSIFTKSKNGYALYFKSKSGKYKFTGIIENRKDQTKIFQTSK